MGCPHAFPFRSHSAQSSEHVQRVLSETQALIIEMGRSVVVLVTSQNPIFLRYADRLLDAGQRLHVLQLQRLGITDKIDFSYRTFGALDEMFARLDVWQRCQPLHQLPVLLGLWIGAFTEYQDHWCSFACFYFACFCFSMNSQRQVQTLRSQALVPPTVSPSTRSVGCPTPTGTL